MECFLGSWPCQGRSMDGYVNGAGCAVLVVAGCNGCGDSGCLFLSLSFRSAIPPLPPLCTVGRCVQLETTHQRKSPGVNLPRTTPRNGEKQQTQVEAPALRCAAVTGEVVGAVGLQRWRMSCSTGRLVLSSPVHTGFGRAMVNRQYRGRDGTGCGPNQRGRIGQASRMGPRRKRVLCWFCSDDEGVERCLGGACYVVAKYAMPEQGS